MYRIFVLVPGYPSGKMEDHEEMSNIMRGKCKYKYSFDIQEQDYACRSGRHGHDLGFFFFSLKALSSHLTHHSFNLRVELDEPYHFWAWGNLWWNTDKGRKPALGVMISSHRCLSYMRKHCPLFRTRWWVASWAVLTLSIYVKLDLVSGRCSHDPGFTDSHAGELCRSGCQPGVKRYCRQGLQRQLPSHNQPAESIGEVGEGRKH